MGELEIPFPIHGRDDSRKSSAQDALTTRRQRNTRTQDPENRHRGATRPTKKKACAVQLGAGPVRALSSTVFDDTHVTYAAPAAPAIEWAYKGPSARDCYAVDHDIFGNVYAIDGGQSIVVCNAVGEQVGSFKPALTAAQTMRALHVDVTTRVYVGVSEGGPQNRARVYSFVRDPYLGWIQSWELDVGGFVEKLATFEDRLLCLVNDTDTGRAHVVVVQTVAGISPLERARHQVPAPGTCMSVSTKGDIAVGSGQNSGRGLDPRHPSSAQILDRAFASWWFTNVTNYQNRKWCVFDGMELEGNDGDEILDWPDTEGTQRHIFPALDPVNLKGKATLLKGAQPANNDTLTAAMPDGSVTEVYRFVAVLAQKNDVLIGANVAATLANFKTAVLSGGNGTTVHDDTEPSTLILAADVLSILGLACNVQREAVELTLAGSGNLTFASGSATARVLSAKQVLPTGAYIKNNGASGRRCAFFNGSTSKMVTQTNANVLVGSAGDQHTLFPAWGNNLNVASSARFVAILVVKPYPTYSPACIIAQHHKAWTRRVVVNRNAAGNYQHGKLGMVEKVRVGAVTTHDVDYMQGNSANLQILTIWSEPADLGGGSFGTYRVRVNGTQIGSGEAEANDGLERTTLGQSSAAGDDERFFEGELHKIMVLRDVGGNTAATLDEVERAESALAWEYGIQTQLPGAHTYDAEPPPENGVATGTWHLARRALSGFPILTKLERLTGDIAWMAASDGAANVVSGIGAGVAWDSTGTRIFSCGFPVNMGVDSAGIRMIVDKGDDFSLAPTDGAWKVDVGEETGGAAQSESFSWERLELAVDTFDNVYVPFFNDGFAGPPKQFWCYSKTGALLLAPEATQAQAVYGISVDPNVPSYEGNPATIDRAQRIALACRAEATDLLTFTGQPADLSEVRFNAGAGVVAWVFKNAPGGGHEVQIGATLSASIANLKAKMRADQIMPGAGADRIVAPTLVTATTIEFSARAAQEALVPSTFGVLNGTFATPTFKKTTSNVLSMLLVTTTLNSSGKQTVWVGVSDGIVSKFDAATKTAATIESGATLDVNARYMQCKSLFGRTFIVDGKNAVVWDARTNKLRPYVAVGEGRVPEFCRIIEQYGGGIFLAGAPDAHNWFLSARPDPFDWNYNPPIALDTQAWNGLLGPPGRLPDVVTGFMPLFDDLALLFCDHHTYRLTGDPASNGKFDLLSEIIGASFGRSWAIGPDQRPFFWSQQGGLYTVDGGVRVMPVSGPRLDFVLRQVDLTKFYVRLAWNWQKDGLDIMFCPYGGVNDSPLTYFWERSVNAFSEDDSSLATRDTTDMIVVDAEDPADRLTLLGGRDGWVRTWDPTGTTDDGAPVYSKMLFGPIHGDTRFETKMNRLLVMLEQTGGMARVNIYVTETPNGPGTQVAKSYVLRPGLNRTLSARVRGGYVWVEIQSSQRWAFEAMRAAVETGSLRRIRS
jgi:hypothetical protein